MTPAPPEAFADVRDQINAARCRWFLGGGQAVNLWAIRYAEDTPRLAAIAPFTSKDVDPVIYAEDLDMAGDVLDVVNPAGASPLCGVVKGGRGEVMKRLPGLPSSLLETATLQGWPVPTPACLFKAKLWNFCRIPQTGHRADSRHLLMLSWLLPKHMQSASPTEKTLLGDCLKSPYYARANAALDLGLAKGIPYPSKWPTPIYFNPLVPEPWVKESMKALGPGHRAALLGPLEKDMVLWVDHPDSAKVKDIEDRLSLVLTEERLRELLDRMRSEALEQRENL